MKAESASPPPTSSPKARPRRRWLAIGTAVGLAVLGAIILIRFYPTWNQDRLLRRARVFMKWKDYNSAAITARRVLQLNSRSAPAVAILAELADSQSPAESLYWHRRLVDLQPADLNARLDLAESALSLKKPSVAKDALEGVTGKGKEAGRYHDDLGKLALAMGQKPAAEAEFALAVQKEPANIDYQIDLASLQIESEDKAVRTQARQVLDGFSQQPATLPRAVPALIGDALQRRDAERAISLANSMRLRDGATSDDSLYYLQLLHDLKHPDYEAFLTELQEKAADNPERVYALVSWMTANHSALLAIHWCKELPSEIVNSMPVPMALARGYSALGDWSGLKPLVGNLEQPASESGDAAQDAATATTPRDWKSYEFMRLALLARAMREQGNSGEWRIAWNAAVKSATDRPAALAILARATLDWKWEQESTELLWLVARGPSDQMWALNVLYSTYNAAKASRNMLQVLTRMYEIDPTSGLTRNNLASLSLLLGTNLDQAAAIAEDLHKEEPNNPAYSSTLAFARHMQGRTAEGIDLMRQLGEERLRQPEYAAYYGVMLAATGERDQAKEFLRLGSGASLLPEERDMVERAIAGVGR